jgi:hypothetical protein
LQILKPMEITTNKFNGMTLIRNTDQSKDVMVQIVMSIKVASLRD